MRRYRFRIRGSVVELIREISPSHHRVIREASILSLSILASSVVVLVVELISFIKEKF